MRDLPKNAFCSSQASLERLVGDTSPILVVTCSDHDRTCLKALNPQRVIWLQGAANLTRGEAAEATVEYALCKKANDIVICGHVACTSLRHILDSKDEDLPKAWQGIGSELRDRVETCYGQQLEDSQRGLITAAEHLLDQIERLVLQPCVQDACDGQLRVHVWLHSEEGDVLYVYEPASNRLYSGEEQRTRF
ncbi:MAG: hypothetical protein JKY65_32540 [Planctomycetes bacterium]|nr:hypothetical protein [Planctomycetota bacterium]